MGLDWGLPAADTQLASTDIRRLLLIVLGFVMLEGFLALDHTSAAAGTCGSSLTTYHCSFKAVSLPAINSLFCRAGQSPAINSSAPANPARYFACS